MYRQELIQDENFVVLNQSHRLLRKKSGHSFSILHLNTTM